MKQAINTRTQEEYDALMRYYDEQGFIWSNGKKPTKNKIWKDEKENTCICVDDYGEITYVSKENAIEWRIPFIPYTEFAKANVTPEIDYKAEYEEAIAVIYLAKGALSDIVNWDEEIEDAFGDQGMRARGPLNQIEQFLTNHKDGE